MQAKNAAAPVHHPDIARSVFRNLAHIVGNLIAFVVADGQFKTVETIRFAVKKLEPLTVTANPKPATAVLKQGTNRIIRQRPGGLGFVAPYFEIVAVVAVEAVFGGNPKESIPRLEDVIDHALRKPVIYCQALRRQLLA